MGAKIPAIQRKTAVIFGASSGIGESLARQLASGGWRLGLLARRLDRLESLSRELGGGALTKYADLTEPEVSAAAMDALIQDLGSVDLIIISAGTGDLNPTLEWATDRLTINVNVLGFAAVAQAAMRHFLVQKRGHLVGISSIMGLRGTGSAAAYAASKAFESVYLDSLRDVARRSGHPIFVTEAQPGFVDTAMMKGTRHFWVASPKTAASQILDAVRKQAKHAYVTRRWMFIATLLRLMPRPG